MTFLRILKSSIVAGTFLLIALSCEEEIQTLGKNVTGELPFTTTKAVFDVFAFNKKIVAVHTNQLPLYQLGTFNDPVYGTRNASIVSEVTLLTEEPVFGDTSQEEEDTANADENETVKEVFLYIPYQLSSSQDSDEESFDLDSIFGNTNQSFTITISKSSFFSNLNPESSFAEAPEFYSNHDFSGTIGEVLFEGKRNISNEEIVVFKEDDPETEEDESTEIKTQFNPGIRVPLDNDFFQTLLNKEGQSELSSQDNFNDFFKSIHIAVTPDEEELMFLLDLTQAHILITYEYQDSSGEIAEKDFALTLLLVNSSGELVGNAINTFEDETLPNTIANALDDGKNADRIYVKGGATLTEIRLFEEAENGGAAIIDQIKANNWIINEASLVFHVDRGTLGNEAVEPPRLYLYNAETDEPLYDTATENSESTDPLGLFLTYDGLLQKENDLGTQYRIRITDYINNIILKDSTNAKLALTLTSHINITTVQEAVGEGGEAINIPVMATINPLGTVLFGSNDTVDEDKKLKLEIQYTEID